jgi:hypothetical protein
MTCPTREGLSPGYEAIFVERVPVELFDRVLSGKTRENKAGRGFFPSDTDFLFSINCFFDSAQKGNDQIRDLTKKFTDEGIISLVFDYSNIDNARRLKYCLDTLKIQKDQVPDIQMGFSGILTKNSAANQEQIELAKKFANLLEKYQ